MYVSVVITTSCSNLLRLNYKIQIILYVISFTLYTVRSIKMIHWDSLTYSSSTYVAGQLKQLYSKVIIKHLTSLSSIRSLPWGQAFGKYSLISETCWKNKYNRKINKVQSTVKNVPWVPWCVVKGPHHILKVNILNLFWLNYSHE